MTNNNNYDWINNKKTDILQKKELKYNFIFIKKKKVYKKNYLFENLK